MSTADSYTTDNKFDAELHVPRLDEWCQLAKDSKLVKANIIKYAILIKL